MHRAERMLPYHQAMQQECCADGGFASEEGEVWRGDLHDGCAAGGDRGGRGTDGAGGRRQPLQDTVFFSRSCLALASTLAISSRTGVTG